MARYPQKNEDWEVILVKIQLSNSCINTKKNNKEER